MTIHSFSAVTYLFDFMDLNMGIAFFHPNESEKLFMKELQECLQKEDWFKRVNQDSMVPPLQIPSFHEKESYSEWVIGLFVALVVVILVGFVIEMYQKMSPENSKTKSVEMKLVGEKTKV